MSYFSLEKIELFPELLHSHCHIFVVFDKLLNDISSLKSLLSRFSVARQKLIHFVVQKGHIFETTLGNLEAKGIRIDKGVIDSVLIRVEQGFKKLIDLLVDIVNLFLDLIDHLGLSYRQD